MECICKKANLDELIRKADYEIKMHPNDDKWLFFKERAIKNLKSGKTILYIIVLNGEIIVEATAMVSCDAVQNSDGLVGDDRVYLSGFRTNKEYQGMGYFSKLFKYMISDLKEMGYKSATLGVEPSEVRNMMIYFNYGFTKYIKTCYEEYPDGEKYSINYYEKEL